MQKRIFINFAGLIIICLVLLAVSFGLLFYRAAQSHEKSTIREKAQLIAELFNQGNLAYAEAGGGDTRMTVISPQGWVMSDSHPGTDININRSDRAEFAQAIANGRGEAIRRSDTLGADTFYYAVLLENGSVLRLSRTLYSLGEVFVSTLPWLFVITFAVLVLAHFIVHRLTKSIVKPLAQVDFEHPNTDLLYEELLPYVKKIELQRQEILGQVENLRKAEAVRREFSANVSHELKTPLTTISALAEMIENGMVKPGDITDFASKISSRCARLKDIIEDIIRLSEFDESKVEKNFTTFDIHDLASNVITALQEKAAAKNVTMQLGGQPLFIKANSRLLDEMLSNLLENAINYNNDGGTVKLDICEENKYCKITVVDTGIGISAEHQGRVFERFYRADASRNKKTGGTGLGLSIVKHIIEHHNGRVELESTEGRGAKFACYIPV